MEPPLRKWGIRGRVGDRIGRAECIRGGERQPVVSPAGDSAC